MLYEHILILVNLSTRCSSSWSKEDLISLYRVLMVIFGTVGNSCKPGIGDQIVDEIEGFSRKQLKENGFKDIKDQNSYIKKRIGVIKCWKWKTVFTSSEDNSESTATGDYSEETDIESKTNNSSEETDESRRSKAGSDETKNSNSDESKSDNSKSDDPKSDDPKSDDPKSDDQKSDNEKSDDSKSKGDTNDSSNSSGTDNSNNKGGKKTTEESTGYKKVSDDRSSKQLDENSSNGSEKTQVNIKDGIINQERTLETKSKSEKEDKSSFKSDEGYQSKRIIEEN